LVIYEAHIKDFTAHPNLNQKYGGSYRGFLEATEEGGIEYLKRLGVNAVEFLPVQKAARYEPPYLETTASGVSNTWNYYGRNHWGYMTSHFFVPETLYASNADQSPEAWVGTDLAARNELKQVVKELHKGNMAVILDVVYNHVSQYDINALKQAAKGEYFRIDENGKYMSESGCGNDSNTRNPEFRRLIVESVKYWMTEYHIDGFRFDLAHLIDWETIDEITHEARDINPNVVLIAEPWGGGYDPTGFSKRGWLTWNDQIRNGVKGYDPVHSRGFIFGTWHHESDRGAIENYLKGTLLGGSNGRFVTSRTSLNYLESHDGYTLGDFIRIGLDAKLMLEPVKRDQIARLNEGELKLSKLAALYLFASQGSVMIHQGQEFGRTKWIAPDPVNDPNTGKLDHNSYEKDNETNYIDYRDLDLNRELYDYYRGLIELRRSSPALRKAHPDSIRVVGSSDAMLLSALIEGESSNDPYRYVVVLNGNVLIDHELVLPEGFWEIMATGQYASNKSLAKISGRVIIPPASGSILRQRR
jgi:pullulanase/glycogen debranching enzyme